MEDEEMPVERNENKITNFGFLLPVELSFIEEIINLKSHQT